MNDTITLALLFAIALLVLAWVAQTIRLELAREQIAERDAQLARFKTMHPSQCPTLARCLQVSHLAQVATSTEES